jgi:calcium/calmodulin-dependent protein kinase I
MLRNKDDLDDICICDFGLADYYTPTGKYLFTRCGTPGYVAPELLQDKLYDYKIDVYSIGILMFILIAGKSPFDGKDYDDVVMRNYYAKVKFEDCKLSEHGMSLL